MDKEYLIHNINYKDNPEDQHMTLDITLSNLELSGQDITADVGIDTYVNGILTNSNKYEDVSLTGAGGGGGDYTVTISNISSDAAEIYTAASIEDLVGGQSEVKLISSGESTETFSPGTVIAFEPGSPLTIDVISGNIILGNYMGVNYWTINGNGNIQISAQQ